MKTENGRVWGDLTSRTKALRRRREAQVIGGQLLRSGTSVGAHCREAQRAKSAADLISKVEGGTQELEETVYWLELS